jgi:hypothetical protein
VILDGQKLNVLRRMVFVEAEEDDIVLSNLIIEIVDVREVVEVTRREYLSLVGFQRIVLRRLRRILALEKSLLWLCLVMDLPSLDMLVNVLPDSNVRRVKREIYFNSSDHVMHYLNRRCLSRFTRPTNVTSNGQPLS